MIPLTLVMRSLPLAILLVLCLTTSALGQTATATLSGTVIDPNGAVVPGASITITEVSTGVERTVTTNDQGYFTIPLLKPSSYLLQVERPGFLTAEVRDILLNVGDERSLRIPMKVGDVKETVSVTSEASLINESPVVATTVDRQFVENMPLNGRSFQTLIGLAPGVVLTPANLGTGNLGQFSVNGQRADSNYFSVDGVSANVGITGSNNNLAQTISGALPGMSAQGGTNSLVSVDALQEFRIQTSSFAPEFGRTPGAQISIATRSGTNQFHGTVFDYLRNDALDSNDWFSNRNRLTKPKDRQNDFGGVIGGPIVLPRFGEGGHQPGYNGRNRTFFFFSYEGLRLLQPLTATRVVPSLASRQAAPARLQPFLNAYPLPNGSNLANGFAQFNASYANPSSLDATSIRIDHSINSKMQLFGRYSDSPSKVTSRGDGNANGTFSTRLRTLTLGLTHSLRSDLINELRANYSSQTASNVFQTDDFGGAVPLSDAQIGFPAGFTSANAEMSFGITGAGSIVQGTTTKNQQRQVNLVDNLTFVIPGHQLKFGVDWRRLLPITGPLEYFLQPIFSGINGATGTTSGVAQFVIIQGFRRAAVVSDNFSLYGQDNWKVSDRLTLIYGLRWDINPALRGKDNDNALYTVDGLDNPATMTLAPRGTPFYKTTYGNFAPRAGAVYQLRQKVGFETVLRGDFGLFYDLASGSVGFAFAGFPFTATKILPNVAFPVTAQQAAPATFNPTAAGTQIFVTPRDLKLPRTYQWNAAVEQSLGANQVLSVTYVGASGRDLLRADRLSNPNPNFGTVIVSRNTATSDYHALQLKFQRRLSAGLQALASYSWAHSIDISSSNTALTFNTPASIGIDLDRGNSDFDVRHSMSGAVTYDIPSKRLSGFTRAVLGGWSLNTLLTVRSALPVDVVGANVTIGGSTFRPRPNIVAGVPLYLFGPQFPGGKAFNPAAFRAPVAGSQGNLGRNVLRAFPVWQDDFAVQRQFHLSESTRLQFRAEFFNVFNHPNFGAPTSSLTSGLFGQSTQTLASSLGGGGLGGGFSPLYQIGGPRSIQLALKFTF